ncbi:MAG: SpoIVB peptidase S55 domain-containing protein [Armatimonadota bacterium]
MIGAIMIRLVTITLLICGLFAQQPLPASPLPGLSPEDAKNILPVSQIRRGMRGYGLTVFHGTQIERFDLEVLGVLKQMNNGKDLILVRIGGGPITKRDTGIIAGMSGSPCYVNGKLIGAIGYGSGYAKEPIGMVTPIEDMLEAWDKNLPGRPSGHSSPPAELPEPVTIGGKVVRKIMISKPGNVWNESADISDGVLRMVPLMTPVMVSGLSARGIGKLAEILRQYGVMPMAGPGPKGKENVSAELRPGAAVGMSLARGDIDITAIGTLTYRRGNKVLAFGHPMLGIGAIDAPLTTAFVDDLISSYRVSFKIASPLKTVGRIFQDRPWSIAGAVGVPPKTIPVVISIDDQAFHRKKTYRVDVINHPLLASTLLTLVVGEAIYETHSVPGDATAEVEYEVVADEVGTIKRNNVFFDPTAVDSAAISDLGTLLRLLSSNRFYPLDVKSVNVRVKILAKKNTATIERIFVKEREYEPGEEIEVGVVLRPYKQPLITKSFTIRIPATAPDGKLTLLVRGGASSARSGSIFGMMPIGESGGPPTSQPDIGSELATADNIKQLIQKYLEREKNNDLVLQLLTRNTTVNIAGEKFLGLPSVIADVFKSSRNSNIKLEKEEVKEIFTLDMIVAGSAQLSLDVKRKYMSETKTSPQPTPPTSQPDTASETPPTATSIYYDSSEDYATHSQFADPLSTEQNRPDEKPSAPRVDVQEKPVDEQPKESTRPSGTEGKPSGGPVSPTVEVKTIVRQPKIWTQRTQSDFAKGEGLGIAVSSDGKLVLVPQLQKLAEVPEQFIWCAVPAEDGSIYVGTGDSGKIYHIRASGEAKVFYETKELEVHSLAIDKAGNLYAGTSPRGKLFKISPDGKGDLIFKADEKYLLAINTDEDGNIYVGVGDAGKIYKISPNGESTLLVNLPEQQVLSLHWDPHGFLLAGTGINGVVYRIDKSGSATPIFDASEDVASAVTTDSHGNIYVGTSPRGRIYKVYPNGQSKPLYSNAVRVLSMTCDSRDNIYAVCDDSLIRIAPDETAALFCAPEDKVQYLSVTYNPISDTLFAGTGDAGLVYSAGCGCQEGWYESAVHDAQAVSKWGRIKWTAEIPEGTAVELQTRTGNVATPDETWSSWSTSYSDSYGTQVLSPAGRFIQYRVVMKAKNPGTAPKVNSVSISYLPPNNKPKIRLTSPAGGEIWSGKKTIRWSAEDPDKDSLLCDVYYSTDGKSWQTLVGSLAGNKEHPGEAPAAQKTPEEIVSKVKSELEKSKDIPEEIKSAVLKHPLPNGKPTSSTSASMPAPRPGTSTSSTSYTWDTTKVKDGRYIIKVAATDRPSNGTNALSDEVISDPIIICNTPPKLTIYSKELKVKANERAQLEGSASSELVEISGVQYRVDGGQWMAASPADGIFDSPYEAFELMVEKLSAGEHNLEIQAVDAAGNVAKDTVKIKVY